METPNDLAGKLTEEIMAEIMPYVKLYNKVYSKVYEKVKPYTDANEQCKQELENYDKDGAFYGAGFYEALRMLKKCDR